MKKCLDTLSILFGVSSIVLIIVWMLFVCFAFHYENEKGKILNSISSSITEQEYEQAMNYKRVAEGYKIKSFIIEKVLCSTVFFFIITKLVQKLMKKKKMQQDDILLCDEDFIPLQPGDIRSGDVPLSGDNSTS